jgi:phosphomannomutase
VIDPRIGYVRDSFLAMGLVLDLMAATGEPLSTLVAGLPQYTMVKEQYPLGSTGAGATTAVAALWDRIAAAFPEARADRRDGLRLEWDDRWVHIRASNTEPIVRVIAEAAEPADARDLTGRIGGWVSPSTEALE